MSRGRHESLARLQKLVARTQNHAARTRASYVAVSLSSGVSSGSSSEPPSSEPEIGLRLQPFARGRAHAHIGCLRVYLERFL